MAYQDPNQEQQRPAPRAPAPVQRPSVQRPPRVGQRPGGPRRPVGGQGRFGDAQRSFRGAMGGAQRPAGPNPGMQAGLDAFRRSLAGGRAAGPGAAAGGFAGGNMPDPQAGPGFVGGPSSPPPPLAGAPPPPPPTGGFVGGSLAGANPLPDLNRDQFGGQPMPPSGNLVGAGPVGPQRWNPRPLSQGLRLGTGGVTQPTQDALQQPMLNSLSKARSASPLGDLGRGTGAIGGGYNF